MLAITGGTNSETRGGGRVTEAMMSQADQVKGHRLAGVSVQEESRGQKGRGEENEWRDKRVISSFWGGEAEKKTTHVQFCSVHFWS